MLTEIMDVVVAIVGSEPLDGLEGRSDYVIIGFSFGGVWCRMR